MSKFASNELSRYRDMIEDIRTERDKVSGRIEDSSFFRIPAVRDFQVISKEPNELLKGTGLDRKLEAEKFYELHTENNIWNKYLKKEIKYLRALKKAGKSEAFGAHVEVLMKYSFCFRVSAFNKVHKGGYKDLPFERIFQITYGMNKILEKASTDLKYFRVHIPKDGPKAVLQWYLDNPGGKYNKTRPLGVPTAPGRVVLHMWNGFLVLFLEEELKEFNHAYTPKVGTMTCLREWVKTVLPKKYIYEFDFKGFFNNVSIHKVMDMLKERGMPGKTATHLNEILWKAPANLDLDDGKPKSDYDTTLAARNYSETSKPKVIEYVVPEKPVYDMQAARYAKEEELNIDQRLDLGNGKYSIVEGKGKYVMLRGRPVGVPLMKQQVFINDGRYQSSSETILTRNGPMKRIRLVEKMHKGLPQGAAPSTTLSLLALADGYKELKGKNIGLLMYADDGFLYSDEPFEPFTPEGLEFAPDKSFGLVRNGIPQKDKVKFLGVEYSFSSNMIAAKTREGSRLQFGDAQFYVIDHYLEEVYRPGPQSRSGYNVHFDPKDLERFVYDLDTQDGSKGQEEAGPSEKAEAIYEKAEELREGGADRLEKLVSSGIGGLALSKLYGGQGGKQFFPEKAVYIKESGGGKFYDIDSLKRNKYEQRVASSLACEWLIEHMKAMTGSIKKARKYATHALRFFKPMREEVQEQLVAGRQEAEMENYWDSKKLSLVPYNPESQQSSKPRSPGPVRLTKRERKTLRRVLMSEEQRKQGRPNAPIIAESELKKRNLKKRSKSVKPKVTGSPKKAPRVLW